MRANLAAADSHATGAFNVGLGVQTSVLQLVEALREVSEADGFEPEFAPPRMGEVQHIAIDPSRARGELGWEPHITLRDGLERTLASLR